MKNILLLSCLFLCLFTSCTKDKLTDEKEVQLAEVEDRSFYERCSDENIYFQTISKCNDCCMGFEIFPPSEDFD